MQEVELKFQVPVTARSAVQRAVSTSAAKVTRLRARYFDTADRRLAAAGLSLRLRQEGRVWTQTLKGARAGLAHRLEHELLLPPGPVSLDLHRHHGTAAADALRHALGADAPPLQQVFETDVRRTHRVLRSGNARVELALDIGQLRAGGQRLPIWELEFELQHGTLSALVDLSSRWVQRHGLWLDVRSKAERGDLLSRGLSVRPATGYRPPRLERGQPPDEALRAMMAAALGQALPNASALAGGVGRPEHLHQLRVGLRRLRSVMQLFAMADGADDMSRWNEALAALFRTLGVARDHDAMAATLRTELPALTAAGGPTWTPGPAAAPPDVGALLREPGAVHLQLDLIGHAEGTAPQVMPATMETPDGKDAPDVEPLDIATVAARRLRRLHRRLSSSSARFMELDTEQQHRLRRQIKRLRYAVEATQSLWPVKACQRYLEGLKPLQDALGLCNDLHVALSNLSAWPAADDAQQGFMRGWLSARHQQALCLAAQALQQWPSPLRAWRRR